MASYSLRSLRSSLTGQHSAPPLQLTNQHCDTYTLKDHGCIPSKLSTLHRAFGTFVFLTAPDTEFGGLCGAALLSCVGSWKVGAEIRKRFSRRGPHDGGSDPIYILAQRWASHNLPLIRRPCSRKELTCNVHDDTAEEALIQERSWFLFGSSKVPFGEVRTAATSCRTPTSSRGAYTTRFNMPCFS